MSTRATYGFSDPQKSYLRKSFVYIHHDGYPEGAANYFYITLMNSSNGCFATQFIRANKGAELTSGHDIHGDTEYKYDVTGSGPDAQIEAYKIQRDFRDNTRSSLVFSGKLYEFVTEYNQSIDDFKEFREVNFIYGHKTHLNLTLARQLLDRPISHLKIWVGKYEGSANWNSCVEQANLILSVFPELLDEQTDLDGKNWLRELLSRKPTLKV